MSARVEFLFDYTCPYAYLASTQIESLCARAGATLELSPFLLGGVFKALGDAAPNNATLAAPKARLTLLDMHRWAEHWGVPLRMPPGHPNRSVTALRATLAAPPADRSRVMHAFYAAYWVHGQNLADRDVMVTALDQAGLDGAALLASADGDDIKADLRRRTERAIELGVFGAPATRVNDGELHWGQDRLDFVARELGLPGHSKPLDESRATTVDELEFWFDYSSPFAYLAATQIERVASSAGVRVAYRPFLLGGLFREIGTGDVPLQSFAPSKQRWMGRDLDRWAAHWGVPFKFTSRFPMRTILPLRVTWLLSAEQPARVADFVAATYRALWVDDRDISDGEVLSSIAESVGVPQSYVERAREAKQALIDAGALAKSRGLCGAPSMVVAGHVFWGQDRLRFVEEALRGWRPSAG